MKIRNGFVSNSSSSSFYIMGIYTNDVNNIINKRKVFESFAKDKWQQKELLEFLDSKEVTLETVSDELIEEYLDEGYYNSYMLITEKVSLDSLIVDDMKRGSFTFLMHDPFVEPSAKTVQKIIDYFAQIEEYEICYELKELLDKYIFI